MPPEIGLTSGETSDVAGISLLTTVDRLDSSTLPKHGSLLRLTAYQSVEALGADADYSKIELKTSQFWTRGRHTLFGNLNGGTSPGEELPIYDEFVLGGFFSLAAFEPGELRGDNYGLARLGYYYRLTRTLHAGGYVEAARISPVPDDLLEDPILTATALLAADTGLGPFYVGLSGAEEGRRAVYFLWGRQF